MDEFPPGNLSAAATPAADGETPRPNLLYTIALDRPGERAFGQMAKMLAGSVARTGFNGECVVLRNRPEPLFRVERTAVMELQVAVPEAGPGEWADIARQWRLEARHWVERPEQFGWIVFLDADCLCLRNIDHLLAEADADILFQPEPGRRRSGRDFNTYLRDAELAADAGSDPEAPVPPQRWGVNAGTWAVRGHQFVAVMEEWARVANSAPVRDGGCRYQGAWNRLLLDAPRHGWRAAAFEAREIQFPLRLDPRWLLYRDAAIVHCSGAQEADKAAFMFGLYMQRFCHDPAGTLLNVLEM